MPIPASQLVNVIPGVVNAGGNPLALNGVLLSTYAALPYGPPASFPTAASVAAYFGASSVEAEMASIYFQGWSNASHLPSNLIISRFPTSALAAFLIGGGSPTLAALQNIGTTSLGVVVNGVTSTATLTLNQTSLAAVASAIQTAFTGTLTATYNTQISEFILTSPTTGTDSTVGYSPTSTAATALGLTQAAGAVLSQGAATAVGSEGAFMTALTNYTQNWATFGLAFDAAYPTSLENFITWTSGTTGRYMFVCWDDSITAAQNGGTALTTFISTGQPNGTALVYGTSAADAQNNAALIMGITASINFNATGGAITYAYKGQAGLAPDVTDQVSAAYLTANGYNFYGQYATGDQSFNLLQEGIISGEETYIDEYVDAIWLNNALQLSIMEGLSSTNQVPYNLNGNNLIRAWCQGPINQGLLNGVIQKGVTLSTSQIADINNVAGNTTAAGLVSTQGYYLQIGTASSTTRGARQSPPSTLWYASGGSVQHITLNSLNVQ